MNEPCRWVRAHVARYHDGELEAGERTRIEEHLAACEPCRLALAACETADQLVLDASRTPGGPGSDDADSTNDADLARLRESLNRRYDLTAAEHLRRAEIERERGVSHYASPAEIAGAPLEEDLQRAGARQRAPASEPTRARAESAARPGFWWALREALAPTTPRWRWLGAGSAVALAAVVTIMLIGRQPDLPQTALDQIAPPGRPTPMRSSRPDALRPETSQLDGYVTDIESMASAAPAQVAARAKHAEEQVAPVVSETAAPGGGEGVAPTSDKLASSLRDAGWGTAPAAERARPATPPAVEEGEDLEFLRGDAAREARDEALERAVGTIPLSDRPGERGTAPGEWNARDETSAPLPVAAKMRAEPMAGASRREVLAEEAPYTAVFSTADSETARLPAEGQAAWGRLREFVAAAGAAESPPEDRRVLAARAHDLIQAHPPGAAELAELWAVLGNAWFDLWQTPEEKGAPDERGDRPISLSAGEEGETLLFAENALAAYEQAIELDTVTRDDRRDGRDDEAGVDETAKRMARVTPGAQLAAEARGRMVVRIDQLREWIAGHDRHRDLIDGR